MCMDIKKGNYEMSDEFFDRSSGLRNFSFRSLDAGLQLWTVAGVSVWSAWMMTSRILELYVDSES